MGALNKIHDIFSVLRGGRRVEESRASIVSGGLLAVDGADEAAAPGAPRWMTAAEEHRFEDLVSRALYDRGIQKLALDLAPLRRKCLEAHARDWECVVRGHLDALAASALAAESAAQRFDDFEAARPFLAAAPARFETVSAIAGIADPARLVCRRDLHGVASFLFLKLETGLFPVRSDLFLRWRSPAVEAFRVGLRNVFRGLKPDREDVELGERRRCVVLRSLSELTGAYLYFLQSVPGAMGSLGALITVPNTRRVLACPLDERRSMTAVARMLHEATELRADGDVSLSGDVFFWDRRKFRRVEIREEPVALAQE